MTTPFRKCRDCEPGLDHVCKTEGCVSADLSRSSGSWRVDATITKTDDERRTVYGWASVIEKGGQEVTDRQGDVIAEVDLLDAAEDFLLKSREAGDNHGRTKGIGRAVASLVFTTELQKALGIDLGKVGWLVGFRIDDDVVWGMVKSGDYPMFSIGGRARKETIEE